MNGISIAQLDEQLERLHLALGGDADDGWPLIEEHEAVELLDQLSYANRKALLHIAAISRTSEREPTFEFVCAVANYHGAEPESVAYGYGWTLRPGKAISPQQTIALRLSQYLLASYTWDFEFSATA